MKKNPAHAVLNKFGGHLAKNAIMGLNWYAPHYTLNKEQQTILSYYESMFYLRHPQSSIIFRDFV